jgi:Outer membrane protein
MFKKIVLIAMILLPMGVFAQELKIAHVSYQEIFADMPETAAAQKELTTLNESLEKELQTMQEEYNKKYTEFMQQQDSLAQSIKIRRMQEVNEIKDRIETFFQQANQEVEKKREELNVPILTKINDAIKAVGAENGFSYILETGQFYFVSPNATDATPLVKRKLGLK